MHRSNFINQRLTTIDDWSIIANSHVKCIIIFYLINLTEEFIVYVREMAVKSRRPRGVTVHVLATYVFDMLANSNAHFTF